MKRHRLKIYALGLAGLALALIVVGGGYYSGSAYSGGYCTFCHEILPSRDQWARSPHRNVRCSECHGGILTANLHFHLNNLHELVTHVKGDIPDRVLLTGEPADFVAARCRNCHQGEWSGWQSGGHSMRYTDVFLNEKQNRTTRLNEDCTRCHGMFYDRDVRDIVAPMDTVGPWTLLDKRIGEVPTIPCLACHREHNDGSPARAPDYASPQAISYSREASTWSLAFYDRNERMSFGADILPHPQMKQGERAVAVSPDRRQALCYQCHAPDTDFQVGTDDDRTPIGVHEGISCLGCHDRHSLDAKASCDNCHPKMSNCGLDVKTMDTSFKGAGSGHNIHWVKCEDCHPGGRPRKM